MGADEIRAETARLRESLFRLKFKLALGEVDAVKRIRQEKKSLARLETLGAWKAEGRPGGREEVLFRLAKTGSVYIPAGYDELLALSTSDASRLSRITSAAGRVILAIDGLQPDVGHEVLWVLRDCLSGEILLARSLLSSTQDDLAKLIGAVQPALSVPIAGVVSDGQDSIRKAVKKAADSLASRYAPPSTQVLNTIPACVGGVAELQAYAGLLEYLQTLSLVRSVVVEDLSGQAVCLKLAVRGDLELLRRIAALDTHLQPGATGGAPGTEGIEFTWQP
jgi:ribosomal protein L29